jgi:hypothetical protein
MGAGKFSAAMATPVQFAPHCAVYCASPQGLIWQCSMTLRRAFASAASGVAAW